MTFSKSKYLHYFLLGASVIYPIFVVGPIHLGFPNLLPLFLPIFHFSLFFLRLKEAMYSKNQLFILGAFSILAILNSFFSSDSIHSNLYWVLWFILIINFIGYMSKYNDLRIVFRILNTGWIYLLISCLIIFILIRNVGGDFPAKNSLGIICAAGLSLSLNISKKTVRIIVFSLFFLMLLWSESRSSLALGIISVLFFIAFRMKHNYRLILTSLILIITFSGPIYSGIESIIMAKVYRTDNAQEGLENSILLRQLLLQRGVEGLKQKPIFGYGINTKYYEDFKLPLGEKSIGVHNGYLSMFLECGSVIGIIFVMLSIRLVYMILFKSRYSRIDTVLKSFLLYGFMRAYGEDYFLFNMGNIFSLFFILSFLFYLLKHKEIVQLENENLRTTTIL